MGIQNCKCATKSTLNSTRKQHRSQIRWQNETTGKPEVGPLQQLGSRGQGHSRTGAQRVTREFGVPGNVSPLNRSGQSTITKFKVTLVDRGGLISTSWHESVFYQWQFRSSFLFFKKRKEGEATRIPMWSAVENWSNEHLFLFFSLFPESKIRNEKCILQVALWNCRDDLADCHPLIAVDELRETRTHHMTGASSSV